MIIPRCEIEISRHQYTIIAWNAEDERLLDGGFGGKSGEGEEKPTFIKIDPQMNAEEYRERVGKAVEEIKQGKYVKVIASRALELDQEVDMPGTLLWGRRGNTPARAFCFSYRGYEATGFSPELVMSVTGSSKVITEPLAGTRSRLGTKEEVEARRKDLLGDTKEIVEHVISVREAMEELGRLCDPDSVSVEDLMSIRERGSCQHLGSRVAGTLRPEKDGWDAFNVLFPSITASGIPKDNSLEAIQRLEEQPRELYSGAVLLFEGAKFVEATLVLRTVFQDQNRRWIQAGAGVIEQSMPSRELTETCEKFASTAPFLVAKTGDAKTADSKVYL